MIRTGEARNDYEKLGICDGTVKSGRRLPRHKGMGGGIPN